MSLEAEMLAHIKAGVEHHNATCPMPARAILLNAGNFELFGWDEIFGLPVEPRDDIPPKRFRVDCPGSAYRDRGGDRRGCRRAARRAGAGVARAARGRHDSVLARRQPAFALAASRGAPRASASPPGAGPRARRPTRRRAARRATAARAPSASTRRFSRSSRCAMYSSSFAAGVPDDRAVAGAQGLDVVERTQPSQRLHVERERVATRGDEDAALAEHGVAAEHDAIGNERHMVERVPRRGDHRERSERVTVLQHHVRRQPFHRRLLEATAFWHCGPAPTGASNRSPQLRHRLRVIEMRVRERDARDSAAALGLLRPRARRARGSAGPGRSPTRALRRSTCSCPTASSVRRSTHARARRPRGLVL